MVPLQLIQDYIGLEKVRYGDRLDMHFEICGEYKNKMIAPLLIIPFVENCFKHGASKMCGRQWIKLVAEILDNQLYFNISNSTPEDPEIIKGKRGIGLNNVTKRLQLLYPGNHILKIELTDEVYQVHLQVTLQEKIITTLPGLQPYKLNTQTMAHE